MADEETLSGLLSGYGIIDMGQDIIDMGQGFSKEEILAKEHWEWLSKYTEYLYKTAFIHGYKHGQEDK